MKIGLVCYAENTGLGNQSIQFYKHLDPAKTMLLDRSGSRNNAFYPERYGREVQRVQSLPEMAEVNRFIEGLDVVVFFERPVTNYFVYACREADVKTVVIPNFEYYAHWYDPNVLHVDALLAPSTWRMDEYLDPVAYVPTPIEPNDHPEFPKTAYNFLHVAGKPIHPDRNGTETFIAALSRIEVPITATITCQDQDYIRRLTRSRTLPDNVRLNVMSEVQDMAMVYRNADMLVMPRRFGGQSLPVNEALGFGIPVIMPNIEPNNQWLPKEWLVPAEKTDERKMGVMVDIFSANEQALADLMTTYATDETAYATALSKAAALASNYSWEVMAPKFMRILEQLCYH